VDSNRNVHRPAQYDHISGTAAWWSSLALPVDAQRLQEPGQQHTADATCRIPACQRPTAYRAAGWAAALREFEHQALHRDTPEHGDTGHLIAQALRAAVVIARAGGVQCERQCGAKHLNVATSDNGVSTVKERLPGGNAGFLT
jgi:hypothetical protein